MVLVSKAVAVGKSGKVLKGYKEVETKTGKKMYFTTDDKKKEKPKKDKPKEKKEKKTKEKNEPELSIDFE